MARLRCASLLKPLYGWAAHPSYAGDPDRWRGDVEPAVRVSDNRATLRFWYSAGPRTVLARLRERTGVPWTPSPADPDWFGGVEVTAEEVVTAYGALALAASGGDPAAGMILGWMRDGREEQSFGVREALAARLGSEAAGTAVKSGWAAAPDEAGLRTHVVAVAAAGRKTVVAAGLTTLPYPAGRDAYFAKVAGGVPVVAEHEELAGALLRDLVGTAVAELDIAAR